MSAGAAKLGPSWRAIRLVAGGVLLETIRRKEFYVLFILMAAYGVGAAAVGIVGIENAATATFLLNLGLTFAYVSAHALAILTAARQIPGEIETRQIYPLLAKPVARGDYYLAKWIASTIAGGFALACLAAVAWIAAPKRESFSAPLLAQAFALHAFSLGLAAAVGLFFSLVMPRGVSLVAAALLFAGGDEVIGFCSARAMKTSWAGAVGWIAQYIPDFAKLNLLTRYTDGIGPLAAWEFLGLALYGALFTAAFLWAGQRAFERRPL